MATVYAVASAKGGVGKTTTTANLAALLSAAGEDVVVVDADLGMANLAGTLGVDVTEPTLHDVLAGDADPADAVHEGPCGLLVIPGQTDLDAYAAADPAGIRDVVEAFPDADLVLIDCGAGLTHDSALPLALADETLLVSTPERDALIDTGKTAALTERLGGVLAGAALTRVTAEHDDALPEDLLDVPVLGRVPEDPTVAEALRAGEPLATFAPDAPATAAYRALATELTGVVIEPAPGAEEGEGAPADAEEASDEEESDDDQEDAESDAEPEGVEDDPTIAEAEPDRADPDAPDAGPVGESDDDEGEEADQDDESADEVEAADDEDELAGSVPFRDAEDDGGGGASDDGEADEAADEGEDASDGTGNADGAADAENAADGNDGNDGNDESDEKRGFFGRLFGR